MNPDGTRTRSEHRQEIISRFLKYFHDGVDPDEAIRRAGEEHREQIAREWAQKAADVRKFLGIKPDA